MKKGLTFIVPVVDKSGSMQSIKKDTIGGFNEFIDSQKKVEGEAKITLVLFDTEYNVVYESIPVQNAAPLNESTYRPDGGTALYDAMGLAIKMTKKRIESLPEEERPEKVIFAVLTDGEENASKILNKEGQRKYTKEKIFEKVSKLQEEDGWAFLFLGANQDAYQVGSGLGFYANNTVTYKASKAGMKSVMDTVNCFAANYRMSDDAQSYSRGVDLGVMYQEFEVANEKADDKTEDDKKDSK
jgi:hypothetical protein